MDCIFRVSYHRSVLRLPKVSRKEPETSPWKRKGPPTPTKERERERDAREEEEEEEEEERLFFVVLVFPCGSRGDEKRGGERVAHTARELEDKGR